MPEPENIANPQNAAAPQTPDANPRQADVCPDHAGERLDRWMTTQWPDLSRSRCKALIEAGNAHMRDATTSAPSPITDPSAKVRAGQTYTLTIPAPTPAIPQAEDIPLAILFEDDHLIVINKQPGLAVHPAVGNWSGTLVNALLHHCAGSLSGIGGVERPGIVHRLDKDTSGVMVVAKTDAAHQGLSAQFAAHTVERAYLAATRGAPRPKSGRLETRLARSSGDRRKQAVIALDREGTGKIAVTNYKTLQSFGQEPHQPAGTPQAALVECRLETGRTHQIRVHMAHLGAPLLGDPLYGKGGRALAQQMDKLTPQHTSPNSTAPALSRLSHRPPRTGSTLTPPSPSCAVSTKFAAPVSLEEAKGIRGKIKNLGEVEPTKNPHAAGTNEKENHSPAALSPFHASKEPNTNAPSSPGSDAAGTTKKTKNTAAAALSRFHVSKEPNTNAPPGPGSDAAGTNEKRPLRDFRRQALHAGILGFTHPITGENLRFETPPPKDMQRLLKFLDLL